MKKYKKEQQHTTATFTIELCYDDRTETDENKFGALKCFRFHYKNLRKQTERVPFTGTIYGMTIFFVSIAKAAKYPKEPFVMFVLGLAGDRDVGLRSDERISRSVLK